MGRLKVFETTTQNFINFAGGNPGAITTLFELQNVVQDKTAIYLITLDKMELYEDKLYMLWNDCCNRDISKVIKILDYYEKGIINQIDIDERVKNVGYGKSFDDLIQDKKERKIMEKKIYSSYAFTENEREKMRINMEILKELEEKYKILKVSDVDHKAPTENELNNNDIVYSRKACYAHGEYKIYKCPNEVSVDELALICDGGNLCFGYRGDKKFISVSED